MRKLKKLIVISLVMLLTILGCLITKNNIVEAATANKSISFLNDCDITSYTLAGGVIDTYQANSPEDLIALSQLDPSLYSEARIRVNNSSGSDFMLNSSVTLIEGSSETYTYIPLGDSSNPFKGAFSATGTTIVVVNIDNSIFNVLSTVASITDDLRIYRTSTGVSGVAETAPLLANELVGPQPTKTYNANVYSYNDAQISYGGVFESIASGLAVTINVKDYTNGKASIKSNGNAGYFCGTLKSGAKLIVGTITDGSGNIVDIPNIKTNSGSAGSLVGKAEAGATIDISTYQTGYSMSLEGNNAGGLVGEAVDLILKTSSYSFTNNKCIIKGTNSAGGVIGSYTYTGNVTGAISSFNLDDYGLEGSLTINNGYNAERSYNSARVSGDGYVGGVVGILNNNKEGHTFEFTGTKNFYICSSQGGWQSSYGGLVGLYNSNSLLSTLYIHDLNITYDIVAYCGGNIGGLIAKTGDSSSYIKIKNVNITACANMGSSYYGTLIGTSYGGDFIDIDTVTATARCSSNNYALGFKATQGGGGLIGYVEKGAVRLAGTTDLTNCPCDDMNSVLGNIIGVTGTKESYDTLLFSSGSGENSAWTVKRSNVMKFNSDVAIRNTILRNVTSDLITVDEENHTVKVCSFSTTLSDVNSTLAYFIYYTTRTKSGNNGSLIYKSDDYAVWSNTTINITADIDMSNTGFTGLTFDDYFVNSPININGNSHTITLDIGKGFGYTGSTKIAASKVYNVCGQTLLDYGNYSYGRINGHSFTGFWGVMYGNSSMSDLTFDGYVYYGNPTTTQSNTFVGTVAAASNATVTFNNVDVKTNFMGSCKGDNSKYVYVGSYVGATVNSNSDFNVNSSTATINVTDCEWSGIHYTNTMPIYYMMGGVVSYIGPNSTVNISDSKLLGIIKRSTSNGNSSIIVGGLVAATDSSTNKKYINISNVTVTEKIEYSSSEAYISGGLLGTAWLSTDVQINKLLINNSSLKTTNTAYGGLVGSASGYWKITKGESFGIKFTGTNSFEGTSSSTPVALLIRNIANVDVMLGYLTKGKYGSAYVEVEKDAYVISDSSISLSGIYSYYDDFVGVSIDSNGYDSVNNGIISIGTDVSSKLSIYESSVSEKDNPYSRYYYNLDTLRNASGNNNVTNITSAEQMVLLSAASQCNNSNSYIAEILVTKSTINTDKTITGTIDFTKYSYYPINIDYKVEVNNANIIFDSNDYTDYNTSENRRHYLMNSGLFINMTNDLKLDNVNLSGSIIEIDDDICGALVSGSISGSSQKNITNISLKNIALNGLYLCNYSSDDYAPLLINNIGSFSSVGIDTIYTTSKYNTNNIESAASSLIGNVGNVDDGQYINLSIVNIGLDARTVSGSTSYQNYGTAKSIFTRATILESLMYKELNTCNASYVFNSTDTYITYGKELSNDGTNGGRNQAGQYVYYDNETNVTDGIVTSNVGSGFFISGYLRYIATQEDSLEFYFELDINQKSFNLIIGCGTYSDPYDINKGMMFDNLATYLRGGSPSKWAICVNGSVLSNQYGSSNEKNSEYYAYYILEGGEWYVGEYDSGSKKVSKTDESAESIRNSITTYLRNAYYMITEDITVGMSGTYTGLGDYHAENLDDRGSFSGVIVGKKKSDNTYPVVTVIAPNSKVRSFGGLINYSNGAVVQNLNIEYPNSYLAGTSYKDNQLVLDCSALSLDYDMERQLFFGGVIGWSIGGDNIISNVTVTIGDKFITTNGAYSKFVAIGGLVGYVGGNSNTGAGGGVIFRTGTSANDFKVNNSAKASYYHKRYVGMVIDGYAFSEGVTLDNQSTQYVILNLSDAKYSNVGFTITSSSPYTITINSCFGAYYLSQIINSGAACMRTVDNNKYFTNAYKYGHTRYPSSDYSKVGTSGATIPTEENFWGGKEFPSVDKMSYLLKKYSNITNAKFVSATIKSNNIMNNIVNITNNLDFTSFDGVFKGIGTNYSYRQIYNEADSYKKYSLTHLSLNFITLNGGDYTIKYKTVINEYGGEPFELKQIGLFPAIPLKNTDLTISNIKFSGELSIKYFDDSYVPDSVMGALCGITGSFSTKTMKMNNLEICDLKMTGAKIVGGFIGVNWGYWNVRDYNAAESDKGKSIRGFSNSNNLTFNNCKIEAVNNDYTRIIATHAAGGFVGVARNANNLTITNTCSVKKLYAEQTMDAPHYNYLANPNFKCYTDDTVGVGGIGGFVKAIKNGVDSTITIENSKFVIAEYSSDNNYGAAGVIGSLPSSDDCTLNNVTVKNCEMYCNIKNDFVSKYTNVTTKDVYFGGHIGGIFGYSFANTVIFNNVKVVNTTMKNGSMIGGLVGILNTKDKPATINNSLVDNVKIYTEREQSYLGGATCGGITGSNSKTLTVTNTIVRNSIVTSSGTSGGIIGHNKTGKSLYLKNITLYNNIIASNGDSNERYVTEGSTAYTSRTSGLGSSIKYDLLSGSCGYIIGCGDNVSGIYATNIYIKDCLCGLILNKDSSNNYKVATDITGVDIINMTLSKDNIGLYGSVNNSGTKVWIPYSDIESFTSDKSYIGAYAGYIIGYTTKENTYSISGFKMEGDYLPNQLNGNGKNGSNYIIFADYTNISSDERTADDANPYLTTNPSVTVGELTLVGDGVGVDSDGNPISLSMIDGIKTETEYNKNYFNSVTVANSMDKSVISTYWTLEGASDYSYGFVSRFADFTCLVVKDANAANDSIVNYITLITNCKNTNYSIDVITYKYTSGKFVPQATSSLIWDNNEFQAVNGAYDNGKGQITVVYVTYGSGDYSWTIAIPVIVQKILYFKFYASTSLGTSYYDTPYTSNKSATLAESGSAITIRFTYIYDRTIAEWLSIICSGENLCYGTNRKGLNIVSTNNLPSGTTMILVDKYQRGNKAYYSTLSEDMTSSNRLLLSDYFTNWESVYLCDLLNITATTSDEGTFIECDEEYATIRIYSSGEYKYYRLVTEDDENEALENETELVKYSISIDPTSTITIGDKTYVEESYYLTLFIESEEDLFNNYVSFCGSANVKKIDSGNVETQIQNTVYSYYKDNKIDNRANENVYLFGTFLTQESELETNENAKLVFSTGSAKSLTLNVSDTISTVLVKGEDNFQGYTTANSTLYQMFTLSTMNYLNDGSNQAGSIPSGVVITYRYRLTDSSGVVLKDYSELSYTVGINTPSYNLSNNLNLIPYFKTYYLSSIKIEGTITLTYPQQAFIDQFMAKPEGDMIATFGTSYIVKSNFSMSKSGLSASTATSTSETDIHFYRDELSMVNLQYYTVDSEFTDEPSGNVSHLGQNGYNDGTNIVNDTSLINTVASYDATTIKDTNAKYLRISITLKVKNNSGDYVLASDMASDTKLSSYISSLKIYGTTISSDKLNAVTGSTYTDYFELSDADKDIYNAAALIIPVSYEVYIGEALKNNGGYFSNYKVELSVSLYDSKKVMLEGTNANDYIIYSNIMFNPDIMEPKSGK